ncbi:DUF1360 domain-containing protein [Nocardioides sp. SYSU D00038]|uniref:DUF1360 domain-containing protein n=1 Tax=Nocardioides sp. SYSU D00038 TaxID=2812554 RepID=UPI001966EA6D|nr:DUF1360 domain-containing protein [Nocardioides sp. SYSU D00038]
MLGHLRHAYDPSGEVDVAGSAGSLAAYTTALAALVGGARLAGRELPDQHHPLDLALGGLAVHKLSRLLSKSSVASPLRAPFTEFREATGASEHAEEARGDHGVRHTVGELITCPFCLGVWVSTAYVAGLVLAPRPTRTAAAVLVVSALSDAAQHAYERLRAG